jgi:hypothetical protein
MLPRLLFWTVCAAAGAMLVLLLAAPWLESPPRLLKLFAEDQTVRRTAFASALGLLVTASVFFRVPAPPAEPPRKGPYRAPPSDAAGA